jgi:hypothetical protein
MNFKRMMTNYRKQRETVVPVWTFPLQKEENAIKQATRRCTAFIKTQYEPN